MKRRTSAVLAAVIGCCGCLLLIFPATVRCAGGGGGGGGGHGSQPFTTAAGTYVSTYDHMDVSRLLKNDKLVTAYIKCFLGEGTCTPDGRQVKAHLLPEIIKTVCAKCSPRQKDMARQILKHIYVNRNNDFERIMKIYDTEGKYDAIIRFMNNKQ